MWYAGILLLGYSVGGEVSAFVGSASADSFHHGKTVSVSRTSPGPLCEVVERVSLATLSYRERDSICEKLPRCLEGPKPNLRRGSGPQLLGERQGDPEGGRLELVGECSLGIPAGGSAICVGSGRGSPSPTQGGVIPSMGSTMSILPGRREYQGPWEAEDMSRYRR